METYWKRLPIGISDRPADRRTAPIDPRERRQRPPPPPPQSSSCNREKCLPLFSVCLQLKIWSGCITHSKRFRLVDRTIFRAGTMYKIPGMTEEWKNSLTRCLSLFHCVCSVAPSGAPYGSNSSHAILGKREGREELDGGLKEELFMVRIE